LIAVIARSPPSVTPTYPSKLPCPSSSSVGGGTGQPASRASPRASVTADASRRPCASWRMTVAPCLGVPSLTPVTQIAASLTPMRA
jgi:hypothetical protein